MKPVQWAAIAGSFAILVWSVPGLIVNPDFGTGDSATAERVLRVDMNGWHALSGFLVAVPALLLLPRPDLLARFLPLAGGGLIVTGIWALFSTRDRGRAVLLPKQRGRRGAALRHRDDLPGRRRPLLQVGAARGISRRAR